MPYYKGWRFIFSLLYISDLLNSCAYPVTVSLGGYTGGRHKNLKDPMLSSQDQSKENMKSQVLFSTPFMSKHNFIVS